MPANFERSVIMQLTQSATLAYVDGKSDAYQQRSTIQQLRATSTPWTLNLTRSHWIMETLTPNPLHGETSHYQQTDE